MKTHRLGRIAQRLLLAAAMAVLGGLSLVTAQVAPDTASQTQAADPRISPDVVRRVSVMTSERPRNQ